MSVVIPSPESFRAELDRMAPAARRARFRALAAAAAADPLERAALGQLLDALAAGPPFERQSAVGLSTSSGDVERVVRAVTDRDSRVRTDAVRWLARNAPTTSLGPEFLAALSADDAATFVRAVATSRREDVAEALLPAAESSSVALACRLLSACGETTVRAALPRLGWKVASWSLLARRHPDAILDWIDGLFATWPWRTRASLWNRFDAALHLVARTRPDRVLDLVERRAPVDALPLRHGRHVTRWMRSQPDRLGALLLEPGRRHVLTSLGLPPAATAHARQFGDAVLASFGTAFATDERKLAALLRALPPSRRGAVFAAAGSAVSPDLHWSSDVLDALPHVLRNREAARIASLDTVRASPAARREILVRAGTPEAEAELMEQTKAGDPDERCAAKAAVLVRAGITGGGRPAALDLLERSRSEREPTRAVLLGALARWPLRALGAAEHAATLGNVLRHAVTAFDASPATQSAAAALAIRFLAADPSEVSDEVRSVAVDTIRLVATKAPVRLAWVGTQHTSGAVIGIVWNAVRDVLAAASARGEHEGVLELAATWGRRMPEGLLPLLEAAFRSPVTSTAQRAAEVLVSRNEGRVERLVALAAADPTVVASGPPRRLASHVRPDLLLPLLDGAGPPGRFLQSRPWVPWFLEGATRWSPPLLAAARARLMAVASDASRPVHERALAIRVCSGLRGTEAADIAPFAASAEPVIAMAAASAVGRAGDAAVARATLVGALAGEYAIPAAAALRRLARSLQPVAAAEFVVSCLAETGSRLTPKRLLLRMAVELGGETLLSCATEAAEAPDAHRDIACAVFEEASRRLPEQRAWLILERIGLRPEREIAAAVVERSPQDLDPESRRRYAALVVRVAGHPDPGTRRLAFASFDRWADGNVAPFAEAAAARVTHLDPGPDVSAAQDALVTIACGGDVCEVLAGTVERLLDIDAARVAALPSDDTSATRDRPALRRAAALIRDVSRRHSLFRGRMAPAIDRFTARLDRDPERIQEWAASVLAGAQWESPPTVAAALGRIADRVAKHPLVAVRVESALEGRLSDAWTVGDVTPEVVLGLAHELAARSAEGAWLAVGLVSRAGQRSGWGPAARAALLALRRHADPAVRSAATAVRVAQE